MTNSFRRRGRARSTSTCKHGRRVRWIWPYWEKVEWMDESDDALDGPAQGRAYADSAKITTDQLRLRDYLFPGARLRLQTS